MASLRIKTALVVYKKSAWEQYMAGHHHRVVRDGTTRRALLSAHENNTRAIEEVKRALHAAGIRTRVSSRADLHTRPPGGEPDLVVSVGGDGTFLEASHQVVRGRILGVNSSPDHSVGFFCACTRHEFEKTLAKALSGKLPTTELARLAVSIDGTRIPLLALNDVLLTHTNPGATSRYVMHVDGAREEQRSSGVWISTPAGSTAGIRAAGGKLLPIRAQQIQYAVRELYTPHGMRPFKLQRGVIAAGRSMVVVNRMIDGALFFDGPRHRFELPLGARISVRVARERLRVLGFRGR